MASKTASRIAEAVAAEVTHLATLVAETADGSTVAAESLPTLATLLDEYRPAFKAVVTADQTVQGRSKVAARLRMEIRMLCFQTDGHPDWAARTSAYRVMLAEVEGSVFGDNAARAQKSRVDSAIRGQVNDTYREGHIIDYALRTMTDAPEKGSLQWVPAKGDEFPKLATIDKRDPKQVALGKAVAAEYAAAGLDIPTLYGGVKEKGKGNGQASGEPQVATAEAIVEAIGTRSDVEAATLILRALSALSARTVGATTVKGGKANYAAVMERITIVSHLTGKEARGKAETGDRAELASAAWAEPEAVKTA